LSSKYSFELFKIALSSNVKTPYLTTQHFSQRNGTAMGPNMTPSYPIIFIEQKANKKLKQN